MLPNEHVNQGFRWIRWFILVAKKIMFYHKMYLFSHKNSKFWILVEKMEKEKNCSFSKPLVQDTKAKKIRFHEILNDLKK
jgi:hypothetical protein